MKTDTTTVDSMSTATPTLDAAPLARARPDGIDFESFHALCGTTPPPTARAVLVAAGLDDLPWSRRVIAAEARGWFSESDRSAASRWDRCAVGRCAATVARAGATAEPVDPHLRAAGGTFHAAVDADEFLRCAYQIGFICNRLDEIDAAEA